MVELLNFIISQDNVVMVLFVIMLFWIMKKNDEREIRLTEQIQEGYKREDKLQEIIQKDLSEIKLLFGKEQEHE